MSGIVENKAQDSVPVRKIKKFRVTARSATVLRLARAQKQTLDTELTELSLAPFLEKAHELAMPAAVYSTFKGFPRFYSPTDDATQRIPYAWSLMAVTVGHLIDQESQQAILSGQEKNAQIFSFVEQILLDEAAQFVWRLILEEAKLEGVELTPRLSALSSLSELGELEIKLWEKIGIQVENGTDVFPKASRIDYAVWMGKGKRRR